MSTESLARVTGFRTATAAEEAGCSVCKRELPEVTRGSLKWNINDDVGSRAMRLTAGKIIRGMLCRAAEQGSAQGSAQGSTTPHFTSVARW